MFNRLHIQLTLFSLLITGTILIGLSIACLHISENGIKQNNEVAFQNHLSAIVSYLEAQNQVSYEWISKTQNNGQLLLDIEDIGVPLIYSKIAQSRQDAALVSQAKQLAESQYNLDLTNASYSGPLTQHIEFQLTSDQDLDYKVSAITIPKEKGNLSIVLLYSLQGLRNQLFTQRTLFLTLDLIALLLLGIFSWIFTKKMLQPIEISREKQMQFVATASHELRTPLMVIQSSLSAMKEADSIEADIFANTIQSESQRMTHLVNDMLTLARADNSAWNLQLEETELDTLLVDVYERYELIGEEKGISLSFELPAALMKKYPCDVMRMEQVLIILIDNALNYTPAGGKIKLYIFTKRNRLEIHVADNGPGVPDEEKKNIFERFYRASQNYSQKEHFGLGLCIAKEIIDLHKGKLYVTDTPGGGATFVISLPQNHI